MAGSTTEPQAGSLTDQPAPRSQGCRGSSRVVAGSMLSGVVLAALLCLVVFPGASEPIITGSALLGFGAGWALLASWSRRTGRSQPWAWFPALTMTVSGALM